MLSLSKIAREAYENGDYATAIENLEPLAKQGDAVAQFGLALHHSNGDGVPQDASKAAEWYRKAAEQGHASAQTMLGAMYELGKGVTRNLVMAYVFFNLAAAQGDDDARKLRDSVANELSQDQLNKGQRMATEWQVGTPLPKAEDFSTWP